MAENRFDALLRDALLDANWRRSVPAGRRRRNRISRRPISAGGGTCWRIHLAL